MEPDTEVLPLLLEDGQTIHICATRLGGEADVSIMDQLPFSEITSSIEAIAVNLEKALQTVKPTRAAIEFGVSVGVEAGQLVTLIAKGTAASNLKITIEWARKPA